MVVNATLDDHLDVVVVTEGVGDYAARELDGQLVAVIGSPGGRTIINTVLEVALNVIDGANREALAIKVRT